MTIRYANGYSFEAVLLSRTDSTMRIALRGAEDVVELNRIHDAWITGDCEPVQVTFAWQRRESLPTITEAECICPQDLAARLIHLLYAGDNEEVESSSASLLQYEPMAATALVV